MIKHIDFIEIAGDVNNVMIIGFRKSQSLTSDHDVDKHASKFDHIAKNQSLPYGGVGPGSFGGLPTGGDSYSRGSRYQQRNVGKNQRMGDDKGQDFPNVANEPTQNAKTIRAAAGSSYFAGSQGENEVISSAGTPRHGYYA